MSLRTRALAAICLMIGFYLLALGIAAGLGWLAYADWAYRERLDRIEIACVIAAGIIVWSVLPRFDRFQAPGPRVEREQQPQLFAEISGIANAVGQEMPHEVYLIPEVNAWVAQRGGIAGLGSRRVMALGVPLMALLTVSQFRAVLAHEFGHYHAGDTKLSPWVYKTRMAIIRTVQNLGRSRSLAFYIGYLFKSYAEMFLRITLAISRAQEYAADQLAARFAGAKALIDGLKQIHRGSLAWMTYLQSEVGPVLAAGYLPPLGQGLSHFLAAPSISGPVEQSLQKELTEGKADKFDSHPSLPERIAALASAASSSAQDARPATDLINNLQQAEASLLSEAVRQKPLLPVSWDRVLEDVWVPSWRNQIAGQRDALDGITVLDLGEQLGSGAMARRFKGVPGVWPSNEGRAEAARGVAACALALTLHQAGWTFHTLPGEAYCAKEERKLEPFQLVANLAKGELSPDHWKALCDSNGIGGLPLSSGL